MLAMALPLTLATAFLQCRLHPDLGCNPGPDPSHLQFRDPDVNTNPNPTHCSRDPNSNVEGAVAVTEEQAATVRGSRG